MVSLKGNSASFKFNEMMINSEVIKRQDQIKPASPILILGVGNLLFSDEGIGVHVIDLLKKSDLPDYVELIDGGTALIDLLYLLSNRVKVIVIDAVKLGSIPGSVYRFTPDEVFELKPNQISVHQIGIIESLKMAELTGWTPGETVIFGIEPARIDWGLELSPEVKKTIPKVINIIIKELKLTTDKPVC
jgi:hydrogenase maturation protease